jgi:hypothetical protein
VAIGFPMGDAPKTEVVGHEVDAGAQSPSPARAREDADEKRAELTRRAEDLLRELGGAPGPRQRFWFILEARRDDLYVRGESSALLAGIWLLSTNTVEQTACDVQNALTDPTNLERAREDIVWTARRRSDELYERSKGAADRDAAPLAQAAGAALDQYGKASGAIQQGPAVSIAIDSRTGALRPEVARVVEQTDTAMLEMYRAAALEAGADADRFDAALARQAHAMVVEGGT